MELHRGRVPLIGPAVIEPATRLQLREGMPCGEVELDDRVRMCPDPILDRLPGNGEGTALNVLVHGWCPEVGRGVFPLQLGQLLLTRWSDESWLRPVGPVAGEPIAPIGDDEKQLLRSGDVSLQIDRVLGSLGRDDRGAGGWFILGVSGEFGSRFLRGNLGVPGFRLVEVGLHLFVARRRRADSFGRNIQASCPDNGVQDHLAEVVVLPILVFVSTGETETASLVVGAVVGPGEVLRLFAFQNSCSHGGVPTVRSVGSFE